jgi:hypothetical protein
MIADNGRVAVLLVAAAALGCASSGEQQKPARPSVRGGEFGTAGCFLRRLVQDFEVLDDRNLIVFAPGRSDAYHVQVSPPDEQLRFTQLLAFESRDSRVCGYAGDSLTIADGAAGPRRLSVIGSYRLDPAALQGLEARFGIASAPASGPGQPQPGGGAEIERDLGSDRQE